MYLILSYMGQNMYPLTDGWDVVSARLEEVGIDKWHIVDCLNNTPTLDPYIEADEWCEKNLKGRFAIYQGYSYIERKDDFVLFGLAWVE